MCCIVDIPLIVFFFLFIFHDKKFLSTDSWIMQLRRTRSSNGIENTQLVFSQGKRTPKVVHEKNKKRKVNSISIELSNSPVEQHSPEVDDIYCSALSLDEITSPTWFENGGTNSDYFALKGKPPKKKFKSSASLMKGCMYGRNIPSFIGDPIPDDEARKKWGWRYKLKVFDLIFLVCFSCRCI